MKAEGPGKTELHGEPSSIPVPMEWLSDRLSQALQWCVVVVRKTTGVRWNKRARPDVRRNFLPVRIGRQWYRLPREAVQS